MDLTSLHPAVLFLLTCVLFCGQLAIAGVLGTLIMRAVERHARRR